MSVSSSDARQAVRLGEVIETTTTGYVAESERLHELPELGALVRVRDARDGQVQYGVVAFGQTGGLDMSRRAVRRGTEEFIDDAIYAQHPELEFVLRTVFAVAAVGCGDGSAVRHALPARPAPLHYSVHACTPNEVGSFCREPRYFTTLLSYQGPVSSEQLVSGHLRWVDGLLNDGHAWLSDATRRLARLMKRDYDRLVVILNAVEPD